LLFPTDACVAATGAPASAVDDSTAEPLAAAAAADAEAKPKLKPTDGGGGGGGDDDP
jgi:hypothetical protein